MPTQPLLRTTASFLEPSPSLEITAPKAHALPAFDRQRPKWLRNNQRALRTSGPRLPDSPTGFSPGAPCFPALLLFHVKHPCAISYPNGPLMLKLFLAKNLPFYFGLLPITSPPLSE